MGWPSAVAERFEDEMNVIEAEQRIMRITDAQMGAGLLDKNASRSLVRKLEKQATGPQVFKPIKKVDPLSPEGRAVMARMGLPVQLVDKEGRPIK